MMKVWDFDNFLHDWFNDDKCYKTNIDISIRDDDEVTYEDGKLRISRGGTNTDVVVSCDCWKKFIDAVAEGAAKEEREKTQQKEEKEFVEALVREIRESIATINENDVLKMVLPEKSYNLLMKHKMIVFNSWKEKYSLSKEKSDNNIDYRIFYYDRDFDSLYTINGTIDNKLNNTKEGEK